MPVHDWSRVDSGIFHDFHLSWIEAIKRALNSGILPPDYYALAEQQADHLEPDVLTLRGLQNVDRPRAADEGRANGPAPEAAVGLLLDRPRVRLAAEARGDDLRRKQRMVTVRHVSGDHVVAVIEIVSPGNKDGRRAFDQFVEKVVWFLRHDVHLLILDLLPPTRRDPRGVHAAIWEAVTNQSFEPPADKPLTLAAYEREPGVATRAYVEPVAVGDALPEMPLFLIPGGHVLVPLGSTYQTAWESVPLRWRRVVEGGA